MEIDNDVPDRPSKKAASEQTQRSRWYDANKDFINLNQPMEIDNDVPDRPSKKAAPQPSQRSKVGDGNPVLET